MTAGPLQLRDEDFDNIDPGDPLVLIDEGLWPAQWQGREAKGYEWGEKLIFRWKVFTSFDKSQSVTLIRYYNLQRKAGGQFKFGRRHDYSKDWVAANEGHHPSDPSRLPLSIFRERLFLVEVVTVRQDSKGRPLHRSLHHSKIGRVIRPLGEGERWERLPVQPLNSSK